MRKKQKDIAYDFIKTLFEAHEEIYRYIIDKNINDTLDILEQCQKGAIELGSYIEAICGEGTSTVSYLEAYCESVFGLYQEIEKDIIEISPNKIKKNVDKQLVRIENSLKNDIPLRKEVVFLPYKADMWDSLESVWIAANNDPNCDAYVVPIPYYDLNPDRSYKAVHYDIDKYPDYVSVIPFNQYDFEERHPDAIFIHNPYDDMNLVTSIFPYFYSKNLENLTDTLIYIPYYATSGGMSEAQSLCPAYIYADYIVVQSDKYINYFDSVISRNKFLPIGSPKFDAVINKCQNPPELPEDWKKKIYDKNGNKKKVYFYNTSINGMLADTDAFIRKVKYVFEIFKGRNDVCLLWRPHPLLESTFDSLRPTYGNEYEQIKNYYLEAELGIYDSSSHIEDTIAHCDVYIGDPMSSVVSLFGVTGKPIFILDNNIDRLPTEDEWRGIVYQNAHTNIFQTINGECSYKYCITQGNKLYYSPNDDMRYEFYLNLSEYAGGYYYQRAFEYKDYVYVIPANAENILVIDDQKRIKKINLKHEVEYGGAFINYWIWHEYVILLPNRYSSAVMFNMRTYSINYVSDIERFNVAEVGSVRVQAARWIYNDKMFFLDTEGKRLLEVDLKSMNRSVSPVNLNRLYNVACMESVDSEEIWLLPYEGTVVACLNILTKEYEEYDIAVEGLKAVDRNKRIECRTNIFGSMAFYNDRVIFAPRWGNKFVQLETLSKKVSELEIPLNLTADNSSPYIINFEACRFITGMKGISKQVIWHASDRKYYTIDFDSINLEEIQIEYNMDDIYSNVDGYSRESQWRQYCCNESAFNTIEDELNNTIHGNKHSKEEQIDAYRMVNASPQGDCGEKVYTYTVLNNQ